MIRSTAMKSRFRKWFIFLFLVFAGCPMMKTEAQAAVAQITIQKSQQDIVKGDVFYVIVTVTSDEEINGFEGYFSYNQNVMQFITGGSIASGNDDEIHIKDLDRDTGTQKIKYSLQFRARKAGTSSVALKRYRQIKKAEQDTRLSVGAASLEIEVISQKEYEAKIAENRDSEKYAQERIRLKNKINALEQSKVSSTSGVIDTFNRKGASWMATKMIHDALKELVDADKLDTGIPDIHARTIQFLINRKKCICGAPIEFGGSAYTELNKVLDYIPPKSIGTLIGQFVRECELKSRGAADAFEEISNKFSVVSEFDADYAELSNQIEVINKKLEGMLNVGELQKKYTFYNGEARKLRSERVRLSEEKGGIITKRDRCETSINELVLKDDNNRRVARFKAYATYMYQYLFSVYKEKETEVREQLEENVNAIFKEIYNGGFSLKLDDKYNIQIQVDDFEGYSGDVETSTAQSISVIFAFIAGVIKMARENNSDENSMLMTEAYPLVMDAPLSAFDKTRIKTVCDALPKVAEQVIIFIKDTDGEIAEENMGSRVGIRYMFDKKNEFETELVGR